MIAHVNGTELFYQTCGQGIPTLLMHGGLGWDHQYFRPWLDALGSDLELIYYDHRGNGRSARPRDWGMISHSIWVEDADHLRAHLGHEKVLLLGHSYGGFLAQEYALRYPERLLGLVLCSTAPVLDYPEVMMSNARARGTPDQLAAVAEAFSGSASDDSAFRALTQRLIPLYFHRWNPVFWPGLFAEHSFCASAFNHALAHCAPSFNTLDRLGSLRVPTLLISGADDWIMPIPQALGRLEAAIPGARAEILEGSGHFPFVEEPARFHSALRQWLQEIRATAGAAAPVASPPVPGS